MKKFINNSLLVLLLSSLPSLALAKLTVVTTTSDLAAIAAEVGGEQVDASSIVKGAQDPHFIEAKPSFMVKVGHADLVVAIGLGLEVGWLPSIIRGSRNPNVGPGSQGYLEVGPFTDPLEVPQGGISRAEGDVHPEGNPHVTLDPMRVAIIAEKMAERLGKLDAAHAGEFTSRARLLKERLTQKLVVWKARMQKTGVKYVVTYHRALNYFLNTFGMENPIVLEPKPGIPPTSKHILEVIAKIKELKIPLIMIENFFDENVAARIKQDIPTVEIHTVPVAVGGEDGINTMDDLYEKLVSTVETVHQAKAN